MKKFEYDITLYPADKFSQVVYFCSDDGDCSLESVPQDQVSMLKGMLNEKGRQGWELIDLSIGPNGVMAFWKKKIKD